VPSRFTSPCHSCLPAMTHEAHRIRAHSEFDFVVTFSHAMTPNHYFTTHDCYTGPRFLGTFRWEPATISFDESFAPTDTSDQGFARHHCSAPSTTQGAASARAPVDQEISGFSNAAPPPGRKSPRAPPTPWHFHLHSGALLSRGTSPRAKTP